MCARDPNSEKLGQERSMIVVICRLRMAFFSLFFCLEARGLFGMEGERMCFGLKGRSSV